MQLHLNKPATSVHLMPARGMQHSNRSLALKKNCYFHAAVSQEKYFVITNHSIHQKYNKTSTNL